MRHKRRTPPYKILQWFEFPRLFHYFLMSLLLMCSFDFKFVLITSSFPQHISQSASLSPSPSLSLPLFLPLIHTHARESEGKKEGVHRAKPPPHQPNTIQFANWIRNPSLRNVNSRKANSKISILRSDFDDTKTIEIFVKR